MNERPTGITANKTTREFTVNWNDGHVSVYPFELLRAACPCASCRGGHENMKSEPDADVFGKKLGDMPATRIANVVAVGSYALTIVWEDGHDYGITTGIICGRCVHAQKIGQSMGSKTKPATENSVAGSFILLLLVDYLKDAKFSNPRLQELQPPA